MQALGTKEGLGSVTVSDQVEACQVKIAGLWAEIEECQRAISEVKSQSARDALKRTVHNLEVQVHKLERKILPVLEAGYAEITPPRHWDEGFPGPDPSPYKSRWLISPNTSLAIFLSTSLLSILIGGFTNNPRFMVILFTFGIALMFGYAIFQYCLRKKNNKALEQAGLPTQGALYILKTALPPLAQIAWTQAQKSCLFDKVRIIAPFEAFTQVRARVDPFIIGIVAGKEFLVYQFNLGEDLKSQA